ncbi:MAG: hypothetical protein FJ395_14045 [Verrucomicrobia bacterium]|nr:hypothetical protein [Verrucomicrobiota bacterium]
MREERDPRQVRGLSYIAKTKPEGCIELPSYETVLTDKVAFTEMFHAFYRHNDPVTARGIQRLHP